jgi:hypothetical protein
VGTASVVKAPAPGPAAEAREPARRFDGGERAARLGHRFDAAPAHAVAPTPGHPLPAPVRDHFERVFEADFADVRVHHENSIPPGPMHAFTRGSHVHFAPTRFRPGTSAGDALIGHELVHVTQQRKRRARPRGGEHGPFDTNPALEREAHDLGARAARGEAVQVDGAAARVQPAPAAPPVQAGLFDLMGVANPRLYAPTWLGGHSTEHLEERERQGRMGPMDAMGPLNPRLYLPTALGGHSEAHLQERREQRRSGPMDLLGPLNPRLHLPTALGGHSEEHLKERAVEGRSGPLDLLGPLNPRQYLPTALGGHSDAELRQRRHNGTDDALTRLPKALTGMALEGLGSATGIDALRDKGQDLRGELHDLKFVTWKNTSNANVLPHMTVKFGRGDQGRYEDFRQGSSVIEGSPKVSAVNQVTNKLEAKPYWKLGYGSHAPEEHRDRFLGRPLPPSQGAGLRYDAYDRMRVKVTTTELRNLRALIDERRRAGRFHLYGEASDPNTANSDPMTTRCMTPLEELSKMRGHTLALGLPTAVADEFLHQKGSMATKLPTKQKPKPDAPDPYWGDLTRHDVGRL